MTTELKEYWNECIRMNNLGVQYLQQGFLHPAGKCFRQAAEYCEEASYGSSVDGFGVYPNHWVSLSEAFPSIPAYHNTDISSSSCETNGVMSMNSPLHPAALCIGQQMIPKGTFVSDMERRRAVLTSRLDWIIDFNLATTLQLCAFVRDGSSNTPQSPPRPAHRTNNNSYLKEAYDIFEEMSEDVAEWTSYSASVDIAIFLMMMFQNQRIICKYLGNEELASRFLMRIQSIVSSIAMQLLSRKHGGMQKIILSLSSSSSSSKDHHCAPSA